MCDVLMQDGRVAGVVMGTTLASSVAMRSSVSVTWVTWWCAIIKMI